MSSCIFKVLESNPNDVTGGRGCLCHESKGTTEDGPFVVFYAQEMEGQASPHAVLCAGCAQAAAKAVEGEVLGGGPEMIESTAEEITDDEDVPEL